MNDSSKDKGNDNRYGKKKSPLEWARFWFSKLAKFHSIHDPAVWRFSEQHVIDFLRSKLKAGVPAKNRLMIVKGLILYRNNIYRSPEPRLEHIRATLQELTVRESMPQDVTIRVFDPSVDLRVLCRPFGPLFFRLVGPGPDGPGSSCVSPPGL